MSPISRELTITIAEEDDVEELSCVKESANRMEGLTSKEAKEIHMRDVNDYKSLMADGNSIVLKAIVKTGGEEKLVGTISAAWKAGTCGDPRNKQMGNKPYWRELRNENPLPHSPKINHALSVICDSVVEKECQGKRMASRLLAEACRLMDNCCKEAPSLGCPGTEASERVFKRFGFQGNKDTDDWVRMAKIANVEIEERL